MSRLINCIDELNALHESIKYTLLQQYNKEIIVTSAFRDKDHKYYKPKSYHSFGLAFDFCLVEECIFEYCFYVYQIVKHFELNGYRVVEFEVCKDKDSDKQHIHLAISNNPAKKLKVFTGIYN